MSREVYDFSEALVRCHAIYHIISPGKEKTPKQKYDFLQAVLLDEMTKFDEMGERKQGMANGLKKAAKIAGLEYEIKALEPKKDIVIPVSFATAIRNGNSLFLTNILNVSMIKIKKAHA